MATDATPFFLFGELPMLSRRHMLMGAAASLLAPCARAQQTGPLAPMGRVPPPLWGPAYTRQELVDAEQRFNIRFPPDLFDFLIRRRFARSPDWTKDEAAIRELLGWPIEGVLIDVRKNDLWAPHWGPRPASLDERLAKAETLLKAAPKLIPLGPNFYIPQTPSEAGNPIFFVFLSDIRYRAVNLADFVERVSTPGALRKPVTGARKPIPFWTQMTSLRPPPPAPRKAPPVPHAAGERG